MPEGARIDSIETLKAFKAALWKFQEAAQRALGDAESDVNRVLMWVENEQDSYWQGQIRKAEQAVVRCKEAVRMKKVFKDATGRQQSAVDEEKALQIAQKRLAEAQGKLVLVRMWTRRLQKEIEMYKGGVQRFATSLQSELPSAAAHLESLGAKLDAYLSVQPAESGVAGAVGAGAGSSGGAMNRGGDAGAIPSASAADEMDLPIPSIPQEQQIELAALEVDRQPPSDDLPMVISIDELQSEQIVRLERRESGWTLDANESLPHLITKTVRADQAIRARPELGELLSLPVGFSVIMDRAGIVEVLEAGRQAVWRRQGPADRSQPEAS
jgi:hypothetical protein